MKNIFVVVMLMLISQMTMAFSYTMEISEKELQDKVSAIMPLEKSKFFVKVMLSEPVVDLIKTNNKISILSKIDIKAPAGIKGSGKIQISGSLSYDSKKGAFYFKNPEIIMIKINKVPDKYMPKIKKISQNIATKILATKPIYKFKDNKLKHKLAKSVLESVTVQEEKLLVKLSAF